MSPLSRKVLEYLQIPSHAENVALNEALRLWRSAGCPDVPPKDGSFGEWLSRIRKGKGATLQSVQALTGIERCRMSRIENGNGLPDAREWLLLCTELGITQEERLVGEKLLLKADSR